jgi:ABC-type phosphate transport system substrate-binding protein
MRASFPLTAERGRIRAALAALGVMAALVAAAAAAAPSAHAAFAIPACSGSAVQGEGSSLQKVAQTEFWTTHVFYTSFGCENAALTSPIAYTPDGSGCGIASIGGGPGSSGTKCASHEANEYANGYRDVSTRFAGSDAPLTAAQKAAAEDASGPQPGVIHQIPVASAAVAVVVHFPEGCKLKDPGTGAAASGAGTVNNNASTGGVNDPTGAGTGDTATNETLRVHISAEEMEKIWDGVAQQTWVNIVPEADFEGNAAEQKACGEKPVIRIVRADGSGTTYNFKAYLSLLPTAPVGLWTTAPVVGDNNKWPVKSGENVGPDAASGANVCESSTHICQAASTGGGGVAKAVAATDGSIGYLDLATARKEGYDMSKKAADHLYWIPQQTINPAKSDEVGSNYVEPTASPLSNLNGSGAPQGANCTNADYRGIPSTPAGDPTLGDWSNAIATGSEDAVTYPVCALTYDFAFDDDAPVYGNTPIQEAKARTVKDYLTAIESNAGQLGLASADYGTLKASIISIGQTGVAAIDWNKSAGSGGGKEEVVTPPASSGGGGAITTAPTPAVVTAPPNAFSVAGAKVKGKSVVLSLVLPGAGRVQIRATGGGIAVANVTAAVGGGQGTVTLPISKAAQKKIAKAKGKKLSVKITITFTPTGGTAASKTKTITITQAAIATKKKKGKKKG